MTAHKNAAVPAKKPAAFYGANVINLPQIPAVSRAKSCSASPLAVFIRSHLDEMGCLRQTPQYQHFTDSAIDRAIDRFCAAAPATDEQIAAHIQSMIGGEDASPAPDASSLDEVLSVLDDGQESLARALAAVAIHIGDQGFPVTGPFLAGKAMEVRALVEKLKAARQAEGRES